MAFVSTETLSDRREVGVFAGVVGSFVLAVGIAQGLTTHHETEHEPLPHGIAMGGPAPQITVNSRATIGEYEHAFGCDIQAPNHHDHATPGQQACAQHIASIIGRNSYSWGPRQQKALTELWTNESHWDAAADNPTSTAYGIPQGLTGSSTYAHGKEIRRQFGTGAYSYFKNTVSQIQWGLAYIHQTYRTPARANHVWHEHCTSSLGCWY